MRIAIGASIAVAICAACASGVKPAASAKLDVPALVIAVDAGVADAGDAAVPMPIESLDTLASRAPSLAAGMREITRGEIAGGASGATRVIARAEDHDACVRVVVVASGAVHASLTDARGDVLASAKNANDANDATLGARGPVCVRKGDVVTLRVESSAAFVARFVGWVSP